jgi:hypothetical protein
MIAAVIPHAGSSQFADIPSAEQATLSGSNRENAGGGQTVAKETVSVSHPEKSGATSLRIYANGPQHAMQRETP